MKKMDVQSIIDSVKEMVEEGNVARIVVKKGKKELLNIPATVGVLGAAVGLMWAKLPLLAAVVATLGYGCKVEVVKADGEVVNVVDEETGKKVRDFAAETVEKVKESIPVSIDVDVVKEEDVVEAEPVEAEPVEEKPVEKKPAAKKATTARKTTTAKKAPTAKKTTTVKKAPAAKKAKAKTAEEEFAEVVAKDEPKE